MYITKLVTSDICTFNRTEGRYPQIIFKKRQGDNAVWYSSIWIQHLRSPGSTDSFALWGIHARKPLQLAPWLSFGLISSCSAVFMCKCTAGWPVSAAHTLGCLPRHATAFFSPFHTSLFQICPLQSSCLLPFQRLDAHVFPNVLSQTPSEVAPTPERSSDYRLKTTALHQYASCGSHLLLPNYFTIMPLFILFFSTLYFFYCLLNWQLFKNYIKVFCLEIIISKDTLKNLLVDSNLFS